MSTKPNFTVTGTDWIDLYTSLSIPNGSSVQLQNLSSNQVIIHEASSKPAVEVLDGPRLKTSSNNSESTAIVSHNGSSRIWVRTLNPSLSAIIAITIQ